jgi:hypothetical protein
MMEAEQPTLTLLIAREDFGAEYAAGCILGSM